MKELDDSVIKIRNAVRWNSTYVMLRASLAPRMVEALVCTQNWLRSKPLINDSEAVPLDALSDPNEDQANDFLDSSPFILTEDDGLIIDA
ncbi:unnamed protein product [Linum trigynum]|uniref:HAT C-terminal dimerisation domain-containing protein n=1 Tax=Linum trigynum TaxID=586398 RepID=A0AAV2GNE0_9ROSI